MDFSFLYKGLLDASFGTMVLYTLVMTHITIVSVTLYLHRYSAHRALELNGALKHFFRFWLWLTTGMLTKEWTAVHRKHHVDCETEEDPHSPQIFGLKKVLWQGAELYGVTAAKSQVLDRFGKGTPDDWIERNLYSKFKISGVGTMMVIDLMLFGVGGLTIWAIQMMWIPFWAAGVVNGIGHYWGYRNFECPDAARNLVPWGILIGGEELHNNHHTYPNSAKFSVKPWEFDLGWLYVTALQSAGPGEAVEHRTDRRKGGGQGSDRQGHAVGRVERSLPRDGELCRTRRGARGRVRGATRRCGDARRAQTREIVADARRHVGR